MALCLVFVPGTDLENPWNVLSDRGTFDSDETALGGP